MTTTPSSPSSLWMAFVDFVSYVLTESDCTALELWTSFNAVLWGLWLVNPWMDMFMTASG